MGNKKKMGICITIREHHYYFKMGTICVTRKGDTYFSPNHPSGSHISSHSSGRNYFRDRTENGSGDKELPPFDLQPIGGELKTQLENISELGQYCRDNPELHGVMPLIGELLKLTFEKCNVEGCPNYEEHTFDMDRLLTVITELSKFSDDEPVDIDDEEDEEDTSNLGNEEYMEIFERFIPEFPDVTCNYCKDEKFGNDCSFCCGHKIDIERLKEYEVK